MLQNQEPTVAETTPATLPPNLPKGCTCGCQDSARPWSPTAASFGGRDSPHAAAPDDGASPWLMSRPGSPASNASVGGGIAPCTASAFATPARPFVGKTAVFLRTSSTARAPVYQRLREKGLRIVMIHPTANREQFPAACIDEWVEWDTTDVDGLFALLSSPQWAGRFDTVASFDEYGVFPAAVLSERFGCRPLPMSPRALSTVNIKSRFRTWCASTGVATPLFAPLMEPTADAVAAIEAAGMCYPIVVKPAPGAGSNLVTLVDDAEQLRTAVARLWRAIEAMRPTAAHFEALGDRIHVLLEEFVDGPEVDVDCIVADGEVRFAGVCDNFPTAKPFFCEVGGLAPSALSTPVQDELTQLLESFVAAMRVDGELIHGVLHFEAKYDARRERAVVIEVNCRMGSAETHTMVSTAFGVDLAEAAVRLMLGMHVQALPEPFFVPGRASRAIPNTFAASANLYPTVEGTLERIVAPPAQQHLVRAMPFPLARGAPVKLPPASFGCLLWLVAQGSTPEEAVHRMKAMCAEATIEVTETAVF